MNNAAVHLCDEVGVDAVLDYAAKLGIQSPLERSLALALGTSGVSLLEITRTYAVFPNGGRRIMPLFLRRVLDRDGNVLLENVALIDPLVETESDEAAGDGVDPTLAGNEDEPPGEEDAPEAEEATVAQPSDVLVPAEQAYLMADMLRAVVDEGTGGRARRLGRPLGGKTGTTNDQADAWFVGFSPRGRHGRLGGIRRDALPRRRRDGIAGSAADLGPTSWARPSPIARAGTSRCRVATRSCGPASIARRACWPPDRARETVFQPFISGTEPTRTARSARETDRARQDLREDSFGDAALRMDFDSF